MRRHKLDVFEVIEETLDDLLVSGWARTPSSASLSKRSYELGDTNEFWVNDDVILTVSEVSGNHMIFV